NDTASLAAVDTSGNLVVVGTTDDNLSGADILVIKFAGTNGAILWQQRYGGSANQQNSPVAVAIANNGDVCVLGSSRASNGKSNFVTLNYTSSGTAQWTNWYQGPNNSDSTPVALAIGTNGTVYVAGNSTSTNTTEYATVAYTSAGI